MKKAITLCSGLFLILTALSITAYVHLGWSALLSTAITLGTVSYHFIMRLLVGYTYDRFMDNKADHTKAWYQVHGWENRLYRTLQVKKWKKRMPTYDVSLFDPHIHTWEEITGAMCQAELVHETIAVLSFLPIIAGKWFGAYPVFIITSILAVLLDLSFAVMQRYNRPRVVRLMERSVRM